MKWNDNDGGVHGRAIDNRDFVFSPPTAGLGEFAVLEEGSEEEGSEEEDEDEGAAAETVVSLLKSAAALEKEARILEVDIPQAFTHFSYILSKRKEMVTDLQGVLSFTGTSPKFMLTDPCIHSATFNSKSKSKHGRTDKGRKGMAAFFRTHQCNAVCELLRIANGSQRHSGSAADPIGSFG